MTVDPDETVLMEALDRLFEALQEGADVSELLAAHPELASYVGTLEELDQLAPAPPVEDEFADTDFGKYELVREIGRGGMGVVYEARQIDLNRRVAIKMILSSRLASVDVIDRFYMEARIAGRLRHPHIVPIHEVGQHLGQHYFAMDYIDGCSLAERLADETFAFEDAARLIADVARAVDYLHGEGLVHRDLKPSNILFDSSGRPFVTDFGLAKVYAEDADSHTRTGTIIGTPGYMSPEQAAGNVHSVSAVSDVYSLGAILYELITGRPAVEGESPLDVLVQVIDGEPERPRRHRRDVPRTLERICLKCLEKEPARRYQSAAALADDLERYLLGEPIEAHAGGVFLRVRRWARRQPALASRLGGLVSAAAIVQVRYMFDGTATRQHASVMAVFGAWGLTSFAFQQMYSRGWQRTRYEWVVTDLVWLTVLLFLSDGPLGPLLIGYPLVICAAGMFFQVRLVALATVLSLISYVVTHQFHPMDRTALWHYPLVYSGGLSVLGYIIGYQVYRVRVLSRFFDRRR